MELGQIGHRFVEPKPAGPPVTGDGDAAVVREIANRWTKEWSGSEGRTRMPGPDAIANAVREAIARGRALGARDASFNNDWFCSTECMGYTRDDIDKGFCVYCAAPVARDGERKP
jgi:hypothetical protein